jgi:quercetin dioxygenase-like cupin family protein
LRVGYVLDGRLHLDLGGMREALETGDCAYLEGDLPVAWGSAGKQSCRILTVTPTVSESSVAAPDEPSL